MTGFRFLHAADLHLDSPFKGLSHWPAPLYRRVRKAPVEAFRRLVDFCCRQRVDFVCLCGDLYELQEGRLEGALTLQKGLWRLHEAGIRTFLIRGNHDPDDGRHPRLQWPPTAHWFSSRQVESVPFYKEGKEVARLYGFSYPVAAFRDSVVHQFRRDADAPFAVALFHTNVDGMGGHENYAPSRLRELLAAGMDYWALGHVHQRHVLHRSPWVVYPGNLQGRHMKEPGEKGGYLVEVTDGAVTKLEFVAFSPVVWQTWTVDLTGVDDEEEMLERIREVFRAGRGLSAEEKMQETVTIGRLVLAGTTPLAYRLQRTEVLDDLASLFNAELGWDDGQDDGEAERLSVWVEEVANRTVPPVDLAAFPLLQDGVARLRRWQRYEIPETVRQALAVLWNHPTARQYLDDDLAADWEELVQEAESLLMTLAALSREGGR